MLEYYKSKCDTDSDYNVICSSVYFTDIEKMYIPAIWDEIKSVIKESMEKISV
jgi:aspartate/glutamate racemase